VSEPLNVRTPKIRARQPTARIAQLRRQLIDALGESHPQSVRHCYYLMLDPSLPVYVQKGDSGYDTIQHQLKVMRLEGLIPYKWIVDATRRGYHVATFSGAADFIQRMAGNYRVDAWATSSAYVEVWCESRSIAGVIQADCEDLGVSLYPAGGFSSITMLNDAAENIAAEISGTGKSIEIIYVGDYDPAGVLIDRDVETKLKSYGLDINIHRIAVNQDQIARMGLSTKPRNSRDLRVPELQWTVEAEAIPAKVLRQLLRDAVESFMEPRALRAAKAAEASEQHGLMMLALDLKSGLRNPWFGGQQ
jgi:hypothetical protein